ncbi:MAG: extracellular solute-binding protein [Hyphomicrobiaceae bacterium]|nr:MAG: extracellular solute-binding protein [Hyphomicrobiaceae bacterium]
MIKAVARLLFGALAALAMTASISAQAPSGKVTVLTSFSKDITGPFKKAFEAAHPGMTVEVMNRNTNAGVKLLEETKSANTVDIFWASAPDAFEVLKAKKLLQAYKVKATGIPEKIGTYPINEKEGFYSGFAASGYGIMWNERYMKANKLAEPKEWQDLAKAAYFDHVSIASPSRSGTTHLTIEAILQGEGWDKGWRTLKEISGNLRTVTERSYGVPEAVNSGQVGIGIVIDFFAFSAAASGFPVKFVYPTVTTIVPANVAVVANAPNKAAAEAFVEFLLSPAGQEVLLEKGLRRLPVRPETYAKAPADYPNPFKDTRLTGKLAFDSMLSESRSAVVDTLFDQLITFQLDGLKSATKAIHDAEAALAKKDNAEARAKLKAARDKIAAMPVNEKQAVAPETRAAFTGGKQKSARQAELEQQWASAAKTAYAEAKALAEEAAKLAK